MEIDSLTTLRFSDHVMEIIVDHTQQPTQGYQFYIKENYLVIWYSDYTLIYEINEIADSSLAIETKDGMKRIILKKIN
jgi:hypothetical protein